eukprot:1137855-Pelagomonas_calceolata.AAC.4
MTYKTALQRALVTAFSKVISSPGQGHAAVSETDTGVLGHIPHSGGPHPDDAPPKPALKALTPSDFASANHILSGHKPGTTRQPACACARMSLSVQTVVCVYVCVS